MGTKEGGGQDLCGSTNGRISWAPSASDRQSTLLSPVRSRMEGSAIRATGGGVCDGQGGSEHKGERGGSLTRAGQGDAWPLNEAARAPPRNVPRLLLLLAHEAGRTLASAAPSGTRTRACLWWPERGRVSGGQAGARAPRVGPSAPSLRPAILPSSCPRQRT
jgi:hypothetical protein